ncbi:MAG: Gfo/Idh/MocA family protein [Spirochaetia bacterium]
MIRTGIIGSGFAADFHFSSLAEVAGEDVRIEGVYSPTKEHRDAFAFERGIKAFTSLESLLDSVDVVHICSPPLAHEEAAVAALQRGIHTIIEKPFTGYFGTENDFNAAGFPREKMKQGALESASRMVQAEQESKGKIFYAENWLWAPVIQREAEIIRKTGAQILWMIAEESHSGSHSPTYGIWRYSGGGSIMGKGCHPLTTAIYYKSVEGTAKSGKPIRPKSVTARTHDLTRIPEFQDKGYIRKEYQDVEDFGLIHIVFEDGTIADIFSSEIVLGGVHNWIEIFANNHRTRCNINPTDAMETYNPQEEQFRDIYVVEKIGTKQGWSNPSPDENWATGYIQEIRQFYRSIRNNEFPVPYSQLAYDTIDVIYSSYLSAERNGTEVSVGDNGQG